jgi:hypothetical protein
MEMGINVGMEKSKNCELYLPDRAEQIKPTLLDVSFERRSLFLSIPKQASSF